MGRAKKYQSLDEKRDAQRKWAKEYYERNKETINEKAKQRYRDRNKYDNL